MSGLGSDPQVSLALAAPSPAKALVRSCVHLPLIGPLELRATARGLSALHFLRESIPEGGDAIELIASEKTLADTSIDALQAARLHLDRAQEALEEYVQGRTWAVEPQFDLTGTTAFARRVYHRLCQVPFGDLISYGELSRELGMGVSASRAVGRAVGGNPVGIFIPCHRVIRTDGTLGGFSGGLERKVQLLEVEGRTVSLPHPESPVGTEVLDLFSPLRPI